MESFNDQPEAQVNKRESDAKLVDLWVRHSLAANYAAVLREKLPEEWLALLRSPADR